MLESCKKPLVSSKQKENILLYLKADILAALLRIRPNIYVSIAHVTRILLWSYNVIDISETEPHFTEVIYFMRKQTSLNI